MGIRDSWHRFIRKSHSTTSSTSTTSDDTGRDHSITTTAAAAAAATALIKPANTLLLTNTVPPTPRTTRPTSQRPLSKRLTRLTTPSSWPPLARSATFKRASASFATRHSHYSSSSSSSAAAAAAAARRRSRHPSERALTEQNMRHQEMLGTFTMKFGRRRGDDDAVAGGGGRFSEDVSPGQSRAGSVDYGSAAVAADPPSPPLPVGIGFGGLGLVDGISSILEERESVDEDADGLEEFYEVMKRLDEIGTHG